jgi:hypothetical protein
MPNELRLVGAKTEMLIANNQIDGKFMAVTGRIRANISNTTPGVIQAKRKTLHVLTPFPTCPLSGVSSHIPLTRTQEEPGRLARVIRRYTPGALKHVGKLAYTVARITSCNLAAPLTTDRCHREIEVPFGCTIRG